MVPESRNESGPKGRNSSLPIAELGASAKDAAHRAAVTSAAAFLVGVECFAKAIEQMAVLYFSAFGLVSA